MARGGAGAKREAEDHVNTGRSLYGAGSGVCIHFVYVYLVLRVDGVLCFFGNRFAVLGLTLDSLWLPWDAGGIRWMPLGTLGSQEKLGVTLDEKWTSFMSKFEAFAMTTHKK